MSNTAVASFSGDFEEPRWHAPLAIEAFLQGAPAAATVKGMFFTCITNLAREKSGAAPGRASYTGFKSYPIREWLECCLSVRASPSRACRCARHFSKRAFTSIAPSANRPWAAW